MLVDVPGIPIRRKNDTVDYALVDPEDFVRLNQHRWSLTGMGYVRRQVGTGPEKYTVYMHREVMGLDRSDPRVVDHMNFDRRDNRKANLRVGTAAENSQNRRPLTRAGRTSRFRGVSRTADGGKWFARVRIGAKTHYLGRFVSEIEAATAASVFRAEHMPFAIEGEVRA